MTEEGERAPKWKGRKGGGSNNKLVVVCYSAPQLCPHGQWRSYLGHHGRVEEKRELPQLVASHILCITFM